MKGTDCPSLYSINDLHELEVPIKAIVQLRTRIENLVIAKDKNLKWCSTPDCFTVVKKPCCCKDKAMCTKCGNEMCFKCNSKWHQGS